MPKSPKGQKRPGDVIGNAVTVAKIATGEIEEESESQDQGKDKAAVDLGRRGGKKGGKAAAERLSPDQRQERARKAARARWAAKTNQD